MHSASLAIWDFDGSIADSEMWHRQAYQQCFEPLGLVIDPQYYFENIAFLGGGVERLVKDFSVPFTVEALKERKRAYYQEFATTGAIKLFPEIKDILALQKQLGMRLALASNSKAEVNLAILRANGLDPDIFDVVLGPQAGLRRKPAPDLFNEVLGRTSVEKSHALVFEDAGIGVEAAQAAGLAYVLLKTTTNGTFLSRYYEKFVTHAELCQRYLTQVAVDQTNGSTVTSTRP